mmetsp:Transcript_12123/g.36961  ORF Transcript_12123/g.36961 Transcript_12123/m.36961 type:complete len:207 (+) Transcript_12123:82-702(+)|eukprot:CAMPEP_0198730320 /NCGR_PEP_ID=MMETSP1475-20131203/24009_1 /TAXON_ID= ORGANISM="Unidentified sp., Strain CCMP1999" /NCGR_SAMPLE_ID=MMETSP1475 /ASSEMBLY_ACC=CAM_ASM_001111 /LENGTH=206 /DNA_ID=CAMNT_0044493111 /DNA_START=51 /DNA_END=671 /DNA_ORIENTATION=+
MVRHNNQVPNQHFRKEWQVRVKTWFNQPMRKKRRRVTRAQKAAKIAPRPLDGALRPVVHCPTVKYNMKVRSGRGFTLDELKEAGIPKRYARTIGIAVDHRRKNRCVESLQANVQRLNEYKSKLIIFPRKASKPKSGDASKDDMSTATQYIGKVLPITQPKPEIESRAITDEEKNSRVYSKLRLERTNKKYKGIRDKRQKEKEEEEK